MPGDDLAQLLKGVSINRLKLQLPADEWIQARNSEAKLIGLIIFAPKSRVNPEADINKHVALSYAPFEFAHPNDRDDPVRKKLYLQSIAEQMKADQLISDQYELHQVLNSAENDAKIYLSLMFDDSKDPTEGAILKSTGLDDETIYELVQTASPK